MKLRGVLALILLGPPFLARDSGRPTARDRLADARFSGQAVREGSHTSSESVPGLGAQASSTAGLQALRERKYANVDYGFWVLIPAGFTGFGNVPPNPNRGVVIPLSQDANDFIGVFAEYRAAPVVPLDRKALSALYAKEGIRVVQTGKTSLGGLRARLLVTKHLKGPTREPVVEDVVSATRQTGDVPIDYTVLLTTKESLFRGREKVFEEVVKSFKFLPMR